MMNKQLAFVKSGLGLALCFLMVGAGVTPPIHASNANVSISQQAKKVTGTVTDAKGEPLLGVNVVVKGTTNGTITDLDGKYSLEVEPNSILVVSYIGYVSQQIPASGSVVNVTLKEDTQNLDEVVVVGYGTQQKKDITGSVAVVDTKELLASSGSSALSSCKVRQPVCMWVLLVRPVPRQWFVFVVSIRLMTMVRCMLLMVYLPVIKI